MGSTPLQIHRIPRVVSITVGVIAGVTLIVLVFGVVSRLTNASDTAPRDVLISEIGKNDVKIGWTTDRDAQGVIEYGTSATALNFFAPESVSTKQHSMALTLLSPGTTYYFQIRIADKKYDNGGVPWTFATKSNDQAAPVPSVTLLSPTPASVVPTAKPTPIQSLVIPNADGTSTCTYTDCAAIKSHIGQGCTQLAYWKCVGAKSATPSPTLTTTEPTPTTFVAP